MESIFQNQIPNIKLTKTGKLGQPDLINLLKANCLKYYFIVLDEDWTNAYFYYIDTSLASEILEDLMEKKHLNMKTRKKEKKRS